MKLILTTIAAALLGAFIFLAAPVSASAQGITLDLGGGGIEIGPSDDDDDDDDDEEEEDDEEDDDEDDCVQTGPVEVCGDE